MARHSTGAALASLTVLAIAGAFTVYAVRSTTRADPDADAATSTAYRASFPTAEGLAPGAEVTVAGLAVGRIGAIRLDPRTYNATVDFTVANAVALHPDASLSVGGSTSGASTLALSAGHRPGRLPAHALITDVHPSLSLEQTVGDYIFGAGGLNKD